MTQPNGKFLLEFDAEKKVLRLLAQGIVTDQLLLDGNTLLKACYSRLGRCSCIVDYTGATKITISRAGIRHLANKLPIFPMDCLVLNIAPQHVMFGMARMFQSLSETRTNFHVVRTMQEALNMIGVQSVHFSSIEIDLGKAA